MKTKVYELAGLCCANCAARMEEKINQLPGVRARLTFATRQLEVTARDPEACLPQLQKIVSSLEPDVRILAGEDGCAGEGCACQHDHEIKENAPALLWAGGLLLAAGLVLDGLGLSGAGIGLSLPVYLAAYGLLGWPVLKKALWGLLRGRVFDEHFLMSIATLGAFAIQEYPEAVGVMLFYRIGEWFEARAVERSRSRILEAVDLRPETVLLADGQRVPAASVKPGAQVVVRPGDRIPLDGRVLRGSSRLDTAPLTGEAMPVEVGPGSQVLSGCMNQTGLLTLEVEKPLSRSMVSRILETVEQAAAGKPRIQRFITRFARVYTPVVVGTAAVIAIVPSLVTGQWEQWIYTALTFLVMSCPCALVLSVPLAYFCGIGRASRAGILFKSGQTAEALAGIRVVALDKTGTLTRGDFQVQQWSGGPELLALCAACEARSSHPVAECIFQAARERGLVLPEIQALQELPGRGIRACLEGKTLLCGNEKLLAEYGVALPGALPGGTLVHVAREGQYLGWVQVADTLKPEGARAVARLSAMGIRTAMLTGDSRENAEAAAEALGIRRIYARLLPEEKLEALKELRRELGPVLFVGDGFNDAPVLAGADVGGAMGSGTDAALEAADLVYLTSRLDAIPDSVDLARRIGRIAWQNIVVALGFKLAVMILGLLGHASLWLAVFADSGVAILCVLNALRLMAGKKG